MFRWSAVGMLLGLAVGASCQAAKEAVGLGSWCVDKCDRTGWREMLWEQESDEDHPGFAKREMVTGACGPVVKWRHEACVSQCETPRESMCTKEREALGRCEANVGCDQILHASSESCQVEFRALQRCESHHDGPK